MPPGSRLGVAEQRVVVGAVEAQPGQVLQGRVAVADLVEQRAGGAPASGVVEVPVAQLVLLGVQVLLAALAHRGVLDQLERRAVDAPVGGQRGRQHRPADEHRAAAVLELLGEDVGRVGPGVGPEEVDGAGAQLGEVLLQLPLALAPGEVRVALAEPDLGQLLHDPRPGERLGQEDASRGWCGCISRDEPLPERERLGVRVVDPEDA